MTTRDTLQQECVEGFSLVETIMYIAIFSIIVSGLIATAFSILNSFRYLEAYEDIAHSSTFALERMTRELRNASEVDIVESVLGTSPGTLVLKTTDAVGDPTTTTFSLSGGRIIMQEGSSVAVPLTSTHVTVSNLTFTRSDGANTEGVLLDATFERTLSGETVTTPFRTFVVLDAS